MGVVQNVGRYLVRSGCFRVSFGIGLGWIVKQQTELPISSEKMVEGFGEGVKL